MERNAKQKAASIILSWQRAMYQFRKNIGTSRQHCSPPPGNSTFLGQQWVRPDLVGELHCWISAAKLATVFSWNKNNGERRE
jgi:hypothetical protein